MTVTHQRLLPRGRVEHGGDGGPLIWGDIKVQLVGDTRRSDGVRQRRDDAASVGGAGADDDRFGDAQRRQGGRGDVVGFRADDVGDGVCGQVLVGGSPGGRDGGADPHLQGRERER